MVYMNEIILQYALIVILVIGLGYLAYLLKEKNIKLKDEYFDFGYLLLSSLNEDEFTKENVKKIFREIAEMVKFVESNYKNEDNSVKEQKAFEMAKKSIEMLQLKSDIKEEDIRKIIQLASAFLPATNKQK